MSHHYKRVLLSIILVLILLLPTMVGAASVKYPPSAGFVNDFANVIDQRSAGEIQLIAEKLQKEQGIEIAVVTVQSTEPADPKSYITGLFNAWGVGGPEDSGLVILLSVDEGAIEVETGYGLEGALPDGKVGAIIDQEGIPHFLEKRYGQGLVGLASAYATVLAGEEFEIAEEKETDSGWVTAFVIFILIAFFLRRNRRYPPGGSGGGGGGSRRTVLIPRTRMPTGGGMGRSGGFGGGRSGGGGAGRRF